MDTKVAVMKVRAEAWTRMTIIIAQVKAAVEKKGMSMAMGSAADSETNYSRRGSVCRKHSNGSRKKKQNWRNT